MDTKEMRNELIEDQTKLAEEVVKLRKERTTINARIKEVNTELDANKRLLRAIDGRKKKVTLELAG